MKFESKFNIGDKVRVKGGFNDGEVFTVSHIIAQVWLDGHIIFTYSGVELRPATPIAETNLENAPKTVSGFVNTEVSVEDIYEKSSVEIPDGWEFVRFGLPDKVECWISKYSEGDVLCGPCDSPRIIVRKK